MRTLGPLAPAWLMMVGWTDAEEGAPETTRVDDGGRLLLPRSSARVMAEVKR